MTATKPNGILCPKWEPASPGAKACRYYLKPSDADVDAEMLVPEKRAPRQAGLCVLPSEMLCVEWVRRNGTDEQKRQLLGQPKPPSPSVYDDPAPLVLEPSAPPPPRPPPRVQTAAGATIDMAAPRPFEPAKEIAPESLEALERAGVEVELSAPHLASGITLVPARTGRTDRSEMTFREAATLRLIVDCFPGAHVTAYRPGSGIANVDAPIDESEQIPFEQWPASGTTCGVCGGLQRRLPGGFVCASGHGGADPAPEEDPLS